jgi:hypothetical protein
LSQPLNPGEVRAIKVAGVGGVPATGVTAVVLNVAATQATGLTYLTVYPGPSRPIAASVNVVPTEDTSTLVTAKVAPDGTIKLYNNLGTVHVIFDVAGWYT